MGTSGDLIADLCVVFFTMLIICKLQETTLEIGVQVKKIGAQIEVECRRKGQRKAWYAPCWLRPDISPGTGTLEKIHIH